MKDLDGKVAVITGAANGIGRALAVRCAGTGMKLVLVDLDEEKLGVAGRELTTAGAEVLTIVTDVANPGEVEALAARTLERFGGVHLLVNNAGVIARGPRTSWLGELNEWEWVFGINFWGVLHGIRTFVPIMLEGGDEGHVVNVASMGGVTTTRGLAPYGPSKHAVVSLSEGLYHAMHDEGARIGVSVLCPGSVATGIGAPLRRPGTPAPTVADNPELIEPDEVAAVVLDAIERKVFYVFSHPGSHERVLGRAQDIVEGHPTIRSAQAVVKLKADAAASS